MSSWKRSWIQVRKRRSGVRLSGPGVGITILVTCLVWVACDNVPTETELVAPDVESPVALTRLPAGGFGDWNGPFGCVVRQRTENGGVSMTAYNARFPKDRVREAKGELGIARARVVDHTGRLLRAIDCRVPMYQGAHGAVMTRFLPQGASRARTFLVGLKQDPVLTGSVDLERHRRAAGTTLVRSATTRPGPSTRSVPDPPTPSEPPQSAAAADLTTIPEGCYTWSDIWGCTCWLIPGVEVTVCTAGSEDPVCELQTDGDGGFGGGGGGSDGSDEESTTPITAELKCPPSALRGTSITCWIDTNGTVEAAAWSATSPKHPGWNAPGPAGAASWPGILVDETVVSLTATVSGESRDFGAKPIGIQARTWTWYPKRLSFKQGVAGDLDGCFTSQAGLTADKLGCTSSNPGILINPGPNKGFTISQGTGLNAGLWYVTNPRTRMDLRTQLKKRYRSDDTKFPVNGVSQVVQGCTAAYSPNPVPVQNNHGINTVCFQEPGFSSLVSFTWNHEGQHLTLAQTEAGKSVNDIYATWEPIVFPDSGQAFFEANRKQNQAHQRVAIQSNSIHTGATTSFLMWLGSGTWQWSSVTVDH